MHSIYENRMENAEKQYEKKTQHYFVNLTRSKNSNYIAEKAQPPKKVHKKANSNIGIKHWRKSASPGL